MVVGVDILVLEANKKDYTEVKKILDQELEEVEEIRIDDVV